MHKLMMSLGIGLSIFSATAAHAVNGSSDYFKFCRYLQTKTFHPAGAPVPHIFSSMTGELYEALTGQPPLPGPYPISKPYPVGPTLNLDIAYVDDLFRTAVLARQEMFEQNKPWLKSVTVCLGPQLSKAIQKAMVDAKVGRPTDVPRDSITLNQDQMASLVLLLTGPNLSYVTGGGGLDYAIPEVANYLKKTLPNSSGPGEELLRYTLPLKYYLSFRITGYGLRPISDPGQQNRPITIHITRDEAKDLRERLEAGVTSDTCVVPRRLNDFGGECFQRRLLTEFKPSPILNARFTDSKQEFYLLSAVSDRMKDRLTHVGENGLDDWDKAKLIMRRADISSISDSFGFGIPTQIPPIPAPITVAEINELGTDTGNGTDIFSFPVEEELAKKLIQILDAGQSVLISGKRYNKIVVGAEVAAIFTGVRQ